LHSYCFFILWLVFYEFLCFPLLSFDNNATRQLTVFHKSFFKRSKIYFTFILHPYNIHKNIYMPSFQQSESCRIIILFLVYSILFRNKWNCMQIGCVVGISLLSTKEIEVLLVLLSSTCVIMMMMYGLTHILSCSDLIILFVWKRKITVRQNLSQ